MTPPAPTEPRPAGEQPHAVGKGRPPLHSRWKPGESGNRRIARPPLSVRTAVVERVLAREVEVQVAGKAAWMPLGEAVLMRLTERAVSGEVTAMTELIRLMGEAEKQRVEEARRQAERSQRCAERRRAREAERAARARADDDQSALLALTAAAAGPPVEEALLALDILVEDEAGDLRLRDWAQHAALRRAPGLWTAMAPSDRDAVLAALEDGGDAAEAPDAP